jgi:hypothetical protein
MGLSESVQKEIVQKESVSNLYSKWINSRNDEDYILGEIIYSFREQFLYLPKIKKDDNTYSVFMKFQQIRGSLRYNYDSFVILTSSMGLSEKSLEYIKKRIQRELLNGSFPSCIVVDVRTEDNSVIIEVSGIPIDKEVKKEKEVPELKN